MNRAAGQKGFTLIEMLVVIAIIALLLGIIVPAIRGAMGIADSFRCRANLRQLATGMIAYAEQNGGCLPGNANDELRYRWIQVEQDPDDSSKQKLSGLLLKYVQNDWRLFACPTFHKQDDLGGDKILCHYAVPTILAGLPISYAGKSVWPYIDTDGSSKTRDFGSAPMIVEPKVEKRKDGTIDNSLGVYENGAWAEIDAAGKPGVLVDGAFEGADKLACRRHYGDATNIAFMDTHVESVNFPALRVTADSDGDGVEDEDLDIGAQHLYMYINIGAGIPKRLRLGDGGSPPRRSRMKDPSVPSWFVYGEDMAILTAGDPNRIFTYPLIAD